MTADTLATANETIAILADENAALTAANTDLNNEVTALRVALAEMTRQRDSARDLAAGHEHELRTALAETERLLESARDIAVRCGAWQNSAGTDFEAHLDSSWPMELVDPEGKVFCGHEWQIEWDIRTCINCGEVQSL
jgi:hypothetical protein